MCLWCNDRGIPIDVLFCLQGRRLGWVACAYGVTTEASLLTCCFAYRGEGWGGLHVPMV